uniref:Reverse transcriptase domain-containing protein n=1 Tax=Oryzias sinensis TaxID=183150 RepID=A0A8C7YZR7_9TELE
MAAARIDAAALCSLFRCFLWLFFCELLIVWTTSCWADNIYSRHELLKLGLQCEQAVTADFFHSHNIPKDIIRTPGSPWITIPTGRRRRRRRDRKQKRGCRAGVLAKLRKNPNKPPLPSIILANVRSLGNKMDELKLQVATNRIVKDCCVLIFTETWLHSSIPDAAIELAGHTAHRYDRSGDSGKSKGGGLCIYVNNNWCTNSRTVASHCSPDVEYVTVRCSPFYLPREFTVVMATAVYIPPDANANSALGLLHSTISSNQDKYPEAVHIIAGDFNHAELKSVFPMFHQHVKCATRGEKTLDKVYSNIKHGYRAIQLPHLGQSDHISLLLAPAYTPLRKRAPTKRKTIKTWPEGASHQLQDCFERTNWEIFDHPDLEEHTATVLCYINHCTDTVTVEKHIRVYPNQKPWMTREVKRLLRERNTAFRSGDRNLYSSARANLKRGIRQAKIDYKQKMEDNLRTNNTRQVWQGIQHLTNYRPNLAAVDGNPSLAEELNLFFARFEFEPPETAALQASANNGPSLRVEEHEVRRTLRSVNPRKAVGPDGITGQVLKDCADQLAGVFTKIFNRSLHQSIVPPCLKSSTIVPLPKTSTITGLKDYRPVALTPIITKCFEKLVRNHITSCLPSTLDSYQFAYRANRSTEDAITTTLHTALSHLEQPGSCVRLLFVDFSSAFNTILPHRLVSKLEALGLPTSTCLWILDFLTARPQRVRVGSHTSTALTLSTGSPQGCVLSPLLYTLYTQDCTSTHPSNTIIKFADD